MIPAYSLLRCAETTLSSAVRTEGRTYGFPWSSRYAPTPGSIVSFYIVVLRMADKVPRLIFSLRRSALNASVIPAICERKVIKLPTLKHTENGLHKTL